MEYQKKISVQFGIVQIIQVVGAGFSSATEGLPGWEGLIESDLKNAEDLHSHRKKIFEAKDLVNCVFRKNIRS